MPAGRGAAQEEGMDQERFNTLLLAIHRASREQSATRFQDAVIKLAHPLLPFDSCAWSTATVAADGRIVHHSAYPHMEVAAPVAADEDARALASPAWIALDRLEDALRRHAAADRRRAEGGCRPERRNCLIAVHRHPGNQALHAVAFFRRASAPRFSIGEDRLCRQLVPHLIEAQVTNRSLVLRHLRALDGSPCAAIADRAGSLLHLDEDLAAHWQRQWPEWRGGVLPPAVRSVPHGKKIPCGQALPLACEAFEDMVVLRRRDESALGRLTDRELLVARKVADGLSHKEIARLLTIAPATVRNHIQAMHRKLGARNNAEMVARLQMGIGREPAADAPGFPSAAPAAAQ